VCFSASGNKFIGLEDFGLEDFGFMAQEAWVKLDGDSLRLLSL
jgi:hypothetical protein